MHFDHFPGHSHDVRAIVIDDTKKGRNTQISAGAAGRRRISVLQRQRELALQSLVVLFTLCCRLFVFKPLESGHDKAARPFQCSNFSPLFQTASISEDSRLVLCQKGQTLELWYLPPGCEQSSERRSFLLTRLLVQSGFVMVLQVPLRWSFWGFLRRCEVLGCGLFALLAEARAGGRAEPRSFGQGTGRLQRGMLRSSGELGEDAFVLVLSWSASALVLRAAAAHDLPCREVDWAGWHQEEPLGLRRGSRVLTCLLLDLGRERRYRISVLLNDLPEWEAGGGKRHDGDSTFQPQCERAPGQAT